MDTAPASGKPRLILHIGVGKTGTSAIQDALAASALYFNELGIVIPDEMMGFTGVIRGRQLSCFDQYSKDFTKAVEAIAQLRELPMPAGEPVKTVVVSAENLINYRGAVTSHLA